MYFHHPDVIHDLVHERQQGALERSKRLSKSRRKPGRLSLPRIKFEYKAAQPELVFRIRFSN